jgi:hypothetical protein
MMYRRIRTTATAAVVVAAALGSTFAAAGSAQAVQASWHNCTAIVASGTSVSASYCEGGGSGYGYISEYNSSGKIGKEYVCVSFSSSAEPGQNVPIYWQVIGYTCTETI